MRSLQPYKTGGESGAIQNVYVVSVKVTVSVMQQVLCAHEWSGRTWREVIKSRAAWCSSKAKPVEFHHAALRVYRHLPEGERTSQAAA